MRRWWLPVLLAGCGGDEALSTNERALAADGLRSVDPEAVVVDTVERTFSGPVRFTPDDNVYAALHAAAEDSIDHARTRLTPSGCLDATRSALDPLAPTNPVIHYELTGCTAAGHTMTGTVTTTWVHGDELRIVHDLVLELDGVPTIGSIALNLFQGDPETRQRESALEAGGVVFDGAWTASYDSAGCGTKSGLATVTVAGGRTFTRTDALTFCTTENLDALEGTLDLARDGLALRVRLLGGSDAEVFTRGAARPVEVDGLID